MRIIQGVGYPRQNKSHFKSTDLWPRGDGNSANNNFESGLDGALWNSINNFLNANFP
jgi:uncharacterized protein (DUF1501 family)